MSAIQCRVGICVRDMAYAVSFVIAPASLVTVSSFFSVPEVLTGGGENPYSSFLYSLTYLVGNDLCLHDVGAAFCEPVMQCLFMALIN